MRFLSVNADCFLIELDSLEETLALYNKLHTMQLNGIKDLVPAAKTILVFFSEIETTFKTLVASIQTVKIGSGVERNVQELIIPICYTGEDLAHFINNALAVLLFFLTFNGYLTFDMDALGTQNTWWLGFLSLTLVCLLFYRLNRIKE